MFLWRPLRRTKNRTDCVRDRLASFAFFDARECLDQVVLVATNHDVNFERIKAWCESEKFQSKFEEFISVLKHERK